MSNSDYKPTPQAFRRISNWFLLSPWSAHLAMIIVTYNGDIKLRLSQRFKNYLRSVLGTTVAPKSLLPNCIYFTRRWNFLPCAQEKKKIPLPLITDNSNEPYKGNNGLFHAFDSLLQFKKICEDENAFHLSQTISFWASVAIIANIFQTELWFLNYSVHFKATFKLI